MGKDFNDADKSRKFSQGGYMPMKPGMRGFTNLQPRHHVTTAGPRRMKDGGLAMVEKDGKKVPFYAADGEGKMAKGGMAHEDVKMDKKMMQKAVNKHEGRLHKGASMTKLNMGGMAYSKGGTASSRADGCATKGKTKGTMVKMSMGGKAC